ncbi:MAG TPA: arsenic resistance protein [Gammaproteobacteria bacterium]|nr:arsenic resistance protein [Gammaproteobacteria bacterium]
MTKSTPCTPQTSGLDFLTRSLPVWVLAAMGIGLWLSSRSQEFAAWLAPCIPLGLFLMIYPAMTKLHLEDIKSAARNRTATALTLFFNYTVNPALLWLFGWIFLRDMPELWVGLILLGVAPCIAMVLVWTDLAKGNNSLSITLMAWNSLIQIITTPFFIWLIIGQRVDIDTGMIAQSVLLYLGLPLLLGFATRRLAVRTKGAQWFDGQVQPKLDKLQLGALLFTLLVIYTLQGNAIMQHPEFIGYMAAPLALFFISLYGLVFFVMRMAGQDYANSVAVAFNATGRNFELAIAIAVSAFAAQPLVGASTAVGPLIEVPLMLAIVWWSKRMGNIGRDGLTVLRPPARET